MLCVLLSRTREASKCIVHIFIARSPFGLTARPNRRRCVKDFGARIKTAHVAFLGPSRLSDARSPTHLTAADQTSPNVRETVAVTTEEIRPHSRRSNGLSL
jgi:hypothetical protein